MAELRAAELRETLTKSKQPRATSAAVDAETGKVYYGDSESIAEDIHPLIRERMPDPSLEKWPVANCAEFNACNNALLNGAKLEDLTVHTVKVKTGEPFPRCNNCRVTTDGTTVTSDRPRYPGEEYV